MTATPPDRPWRCTAGGVLLTVRATPRAARDGVDGLAGTPQGPAVQVRVRAVPDEGRANAAVAAAVAAWLGVPGRSVAVARGHRSRVKTLEIAGDPATLHKLLTARLAALA